MGAAVFPRFPANCLRVGVRCIRRAVIARLVLEPLAILVPHIVDEICCCCRRLAGSQSAQDVALRQCHWPSMAALKESPGPTRHIGAASAAPNCPAGILEDVRAMNGLGYAALTLFNSHRSHGASCSRVSPAHFAFQAASLASTKGVSFLKWNFMAHFVIVRPTFRRSRRLGPVLVCPCGS